MSRTLVPGTIVVRINGALYRMTSEQYRQFQRTGIARGIPIRGVLQDLRMER